MKSTELWPILDHRNLGPYWSTLELAAVLSMTTSRVAALTREHHILVVPDQTGVPLYPTWAMGRRGDGVSIVEGLDEVLHALERSTEERLLHALWLSGLLPKHQGWWAIEALLRGERERVMTLARNEDWSCLAE